MKTFNLFSFLALISLMLFSCSKEKFDPKADLTKDAINEPASFTVAESGFEIKEIQELGGLQNDLFTEGMIEYSKSSVIMATVDFGPVAEKGTARVNKDGQEFEIELKKENSKDKIKKQIITPIVKAEDCGYEIVSGMIKYYNWETGMWIATVDFGDGSCDNLAVKATMDGVFTFAVSDYF